MRTAILMATTTLALAACGPKANDTTPNANAMASSDNMMVMPGEGDNSAAMESVSTEDFVAKAAMSDMYETTSSKMAASMATTPALKSFAKQMIDAHTATTRELKAAKAKDNVIAMPPATLDAEHQALIDALKGAKGAAFDTLYRTQQTDAHTKALALMQAYAASGDKPAVKAFAAATAPKVKSHLDMLTAM